MKLRNKRYIDRQKAIKDMIEFKDLYSFLKAGFAMSRSLVVKKDIINTLIELKQPNKQILYKNVA